MAGNAEREAGRLPGELLPVVARTSAAIEAGRLPGELLPVVARSAAAIAAARATPWPSYVAVLLDEITPEVDRMVDRLRGVSRGWLCSGHDEQRRITLLMLAQKMALILAERRPSGEPDAGEHG